MGFEFKILGPLQVTRDGVPVDIRAGKLRALVVALLLDVNRVVTVETLIARLWGEEPPGGARNALQNYVLRVRRLLGEPCPLITHPHGYCLRVDEDDVDLRRFDALVARAKAATRPEQAAALLTEALGLWRGRPLADVGSEALRAEMEPVLDERRRSAVELRIDADLRLGRHADILSELRELTSAHPLQERFWAQRMLALYRSGRQGEALQCYREAARLLADELGIDPGPELQDLHRRMLNADPGLELRRDHPAMPPRRGNLPAETTSFVGRERQLAHAARLLRQARLVTMLGAGGVGKTRLALKAAAQAAPDFPDGVWLVDLAPLTDPALLAITVAEAVEPGDRVHDVRPVPRGGRLGPRGGRDRPRRRGGARAARARRPGLDPVARAGAGAAAARGADRRGHWITLLWTMASAFLGDQESALRAGKEYLAEAERYEADWAMTWALWGAGLVEMCHGDPHRATTLFRDAICRQRALGDTWSPIWGVELLAWNFARTGDHHEAARLLGAAHRLRQSFGVALYGPFRQAHQDAVEYVRRTLGDGYGVAFDQGAANVDPVRLALEGCAVPALEANAALSGNGRPPAPQVGTG